MKLKVCVLFLVSILIVAMGYLVAILLSCDAWNTREMYCANVDMFSKFYADNLRGNLFSGFLALGGFLLSLKTFIVVTMKENVYNNNKYIENWERTRKFKPDQKLHAPLKQLSDFLFYAIFASILSAVLHMSLGLYGSVPAAVISVWSSIFAILLLVWCLVLIKKNLDTWFTYLD